MLSFDGKQQILILQQAEHPIDIKELITVVRSFFLSNRSICCTWSTIAITTIRAVWRRTATTSCV
jgi:hypothetical protein